MHVSGARHVIPECCYVITQYSAYKLIAKIKPLNRDRGARVEQKTFSRWEDIRCWCCRSRYRRMFEAELPVRSEFEAPTIAGLAMEVQKAQAMGLRARSPILQPRHAASADASQDALLIQLEKLPAMRRPICYRTCWMENRTINFERDHGVAA
jgi:hypothetical protein